MKAIIVLLLLSISGTIYSQDYATLKKSDTIYVLFKGKKKENKGVSADHVDRSYDFFDFDEPLYFFHYKYLGYERKIANIVSDVKIVDKSFIKKNKAKIITPKFIKNNSLCKIVAEILNNSKTIYIIDYTEKKNTKIKLYEVKMNTTVCNGDG
ncbi:hypothetical protein GJU43_00585 [Flavobacterium sp. LC2016-23]|uniref:hypothetical protein n=1 Tax=Flavobacterium sp. LC2016-23 TaxID=2666330 RepID=UPI0012AF2794|nr:hypothetical protein [Flavobacterium sp. LC2016-23]MRX37758.1 hypothetical protein [Flavobacterium sp. LC2016-23]